MTAASFSTANAYVADVTEPKDRAKAFGLDGLGLQFRLPDRPGVRGFLAGEFMHGYLGDFRLRLPFLVAAGLTSINCSTGSSSCRNPCRRSAG